VDELASIDTMALVGRRITLDPGHGGFFRGALGTNGLTEAEVNLGVALQLRGLLEARGAQVLMTRTDDRDFLTPADSSLRSDLAERVRMSEAFGPDLFVSIHHNADARGAHDVNETQTYYKLGDDGPSLDAAQSVHRYLVRNIGIEKHKILPGNFYVLRNTSAPAILTESSYITNPDVESKLALASKQRLEAEAILLGIADFFGRPRPTIDQLTAQRSVGAPPETLFTNDVVSPVITARVAGPFDDYELRLGDRVIDGMREGESLVFEPGPLESGRYDAWLRARLSGAATARDAHVSFTVRRDPTGLVAERFGPAPGPEGGIVAVRFGVFDRAGLPYRDSVVVSVLSTKGIAPHDTVLVSRNGEAWGYFRVAARASGTSISARTWPSAQGDPARAQTSEGRHDGGDLARLSVPQRPRAADSVGCFLLEMPAGTTLRPISAQRSDLASRPPARPVAAGMAASTIDASPPRAWVNRDGFAVIAKGEGGRPRVPELPGYRAWAAGGSSGASAAWPPRFVAVANGALHGKRIVIDPDGGGENDAGTGPSGTRAANLNLDVARALASYLTGAGAEVRLTREGDVALSDVERVQISEAFHADRFLRIGHRAEPPMVGYYFSSAPGKRWAERTRATLSSLSLPAPAPAEDAQYPLQQTSCPALYVGAARIDEAASEERLSSPAARRAEAYALYVALAREWSDASWPADSVVVRDPTGAPARGAAVTLGGSQLLMTDRRGVARFLWTEPGPMEVTIEHPSVRERRLLSSPGGDGRVTGSGNN